MPVWVRGLTPYGLPPCMLHAKGGHLPGRMEWHMFSYKGQPGYMDCTSGFITLFINRVALEESQISRILKSLIW